MLLPTVAFLVGVLLGGLVVGLGDDDGGDPGPDGDATSTEARTEPGEPESSDVTIVIPQECLAAAQTAERATELVRGGVRAIREFRRDEVIELLNDLEDLEAQAKEQTERCRDVEVNRSP